MIFCQLTKNYILFFTQYSQYFSGFYNRALTHNLTYQIVYNNVDKYRQISIHLLKKHIPFFRYIWWIAINGFGLDFVCKQPERLPFSPPRTGPCGTTLATARLRSAATFGRWIRFAVRAHPLATLLRKAPRLARRGTWRLRRRCILRLPNLIASRQAYSCARS